MNSTTRPLLASHPGPEANNKKQNRLHSFTLCGLSFFYLMLFETKVDGEVVHWGHAMVLRVKSFASHQWDSTFSTSIIYLILLLFIISDICYLLVIIIYYSPHYYCHEGTFYHQFYYHFCGINWCIIDGGKWNNSTSFSSQVYPALGF